MQNERILGRLMARELNPAEVAKVGGAGLGGIIGPSSDATYSGGAIYADYVPDTHSELSPSPTEKAIANF